MTTLQLQVNGLTTENQSARLATTLRSMFGINVVSIDNRTALGLP